MTDTIEKNVAVDGAMGNEGERSWSMFSMAHGTPVGPLGSGQRWRTVRKKASVRRPALAKAAEKEKEHESAVSFERARGLVSLA